MQKREETFEIVCEYMCLENSYGVVKANKNVKMEFTVGVIPEEERGYFEMYDVESGGDRYYAEGSLTFDGNQLIDYDGVFTLSDVITKKLQSWGYHTDEIMLED